VRGAAIGGRVVTITCPGARTGGQPEHHEEHARGEADQDGAAAPGQAERRVRGRIGATWPTRRGP
jgi:hypothetical protein